MELQRRRRALLSLNARQIAELVEELGELCVGLVLRDVQPLPPRDLLLVLEPDAPAGGPAVLRLRVSADKDASRLHLQQGRLQRGKGPVGPFFVRTLEELQGASLARVQQVRGDRLVIFEFRGAPGGRRALLAELTGRHANLVLLGQGDKVLDLLVPSPAKHKDPRLVLGEVWRPPPGSAPASAELAAIRDEFEEPSEVTPGIAAGHPELAPLSWRVEVALGGEAQDRDLAGARKKLRKRVERKLSRARSLQHGLERKFEACESSERVRLDGELLSANLQRLKRGLDSIELEDWYVDGTPMRLIELDPRRNPKENVERYFARYKKLERSKGELPSEIERATRRVEELEEVLRAAADPERDPDEVDALAVEKGLLDPLQEADLRKRKAPAPRLPYRVFRACHGSEIRVGRSAKDNDALTFRHAHGNDLWLHTADAPGSHVVLRVPGKSTTPDQEEVLDAAHLAVHFSPLREASRAAVHIAERKWVHKPRGAKAGLVTLSGGRKLEIRLQPERVARLLRPHRDES